MIDENSLFIYKGEFNSQIVNILLSNIKRKIKKDIQDIRLRKRFYQIAVECIENINRHSGWGIEENRLNEIDSLFYLKRSDNSLLTISGNLISKEEKKVLSEKLDYVLSLNIDELKKAYRKQLMSEKISKRGGAGVGLYDIALKTDKNIKYNFYPVNDDLFFYLLTVELKLN